MANVDAFVHPAALMMTLIVVPLSLAADVLADRVLCAVNTLVSTPAPASVSFSHREMVSVARVSGRVVVVVVRELFSLVTVYHMTQGFRLLLRSHHSKFVGTI